MKKGLINYVIIASLLVFICLLFAFKETGHSYEHMFIVTRNDDLDYVWVSTNKGRTRLKNLKKESQGEWDLSPLINEIERYEADGWVLQECSGVGNLSQYWLRKEK